MKYDTYIMYRVKALIQANKCIQFIVLCRKCVVLQSFTHTFLNVQLVLNFLLYLIAEPSK